MNTNVVYTVRGPSAVNSENSADDSGFYNSTTDVTDVADWGAHAARVC